jgi:CRISPR-associated protein Cas2
LTSFGWPHTPIIGQAIAYALRHWTALARFLDNGFLAIDNNIAQTCEDFGFRRQYSVFLCRLTAHDLVRLKSRLYNVIKLDEDQVLFIPLCNRCIEQIEALGRPTEAHDAKDVVIVT